MHAKQRNTSYIGVLLSVLLLALVVTACSSMQSQLHEYIGKADSAVSAAKADNAAEDAPADLKLAEKELKWAKDDLQLIGYQSDDERFNHSETSLYMAQKSTIDAKVASASAQYTQLNREVDTLQHEVDQMYKKVE